MCSVSKVYFSFLIPPPLCSLLVALCLLALLLLPLDCYCPFLPLPPQHALLHSPVFTRVIAITPLLLYHFPLSLLFYLSCLLTACSHLSTPLFARSSFFSFSILHVSLFLSFLLFLSLYFSFIISWNTSSLIPSILLFYPHIPLLIHSHFHPLFHSSFFSLSLHPSFSHSLLSRFVLLLSLIPSVPSSLSFSLALPYREQRVAAGLQFSVKPHSIFYHFLFLLQPSPW